MSVGTVKRLLCFAWESYGRAAKDDAKNVMSYWDGYIRALQHVLEQERE